MQKMPVVIETVLLLLLVHLVQGRLECDKVITVNTTAGNDTSDCLKGEYPCSSLDYVLSNIQSNACINIISDSVSLSVLVQIDNISNITIKGQGNTTVMCNNTGGVSYYNCYDVVIEGITWDRCVHNHNHSNLHIAGGIQFNRIVNLNITNCNFQYSKVRALSLLNVSGAIVVDGSKFLFNANDDTITCASAQTGYIHCSTPDFTSTGGMYVEEATGNTTINILNSVFRYNGHFGQVVDKLFLTLPFDSKYSEVADGAGLKILLSAMDVFPNITIENSVFDSNRGRSGGGLYIHTINSSTTITLKNVEFQNNSVIKPYITGAALLISFEKGNISTLPCSIFIDTCKFLQNTDGRTTASVAVAGTSNLPRISVDNCAFVENNKYEAGLVELNFKSNDSMTSCDISNSIFENNTGSALIRIKTDAGNNMISIHSIRAYNNTGYSSTSCRGGFIVFEVNTKNCSVSISNFSLVSNHHLSNQSEAGGLYITGRLNTKFSFQLHIEDSKFEQNTGRGPGAVIYCALSGDSNFYLVTIYNSTFSKNIGDSVIYIEKSSNAEIRNMSIPAALIIGSNTKFNKNVGTALQLSNMVLIGYQNTSFVHNKAVNGAALSLNNSYLFLNCSTFRFIIKENLAYQRGGAIYITSLPQNHWLLGIANSSTQAISDIIQDYLSYYDDKGEIFNQTDPNYHIDFSYNIALITGSTIFIEINPKNAMLSDSHNSSDPKSLFYIPENFTAIAHSEEVPVIVTQPQRLQLKSPAMCEDGNATNCTIPNIMLGQDINVPASIYGYNNEPAETTKFLVNCTENCEHKITGDTLIRVYTKFSGIKITGTKINKDTTESMVLGVTGVGINVGIIVNVTLVPCHVGYKYNESMERCDCCTVNDIISCTDEATAMIKRNHWYGVLNEVATVSVCPNGYCSFARDDEVSPGKYLLSKTQDNQCASNRTGPACGKCAEGYTLSFDSTVCVDNRECTAGITTVVVMCSVLYWIAIMVFVFILMYYKINIGYFYGIINCYTIIDILFGSILNLSDGLNDFVTISVGIVKTTPKFLGKLCFVRGLRGIDQQAIHFIHPAILLLILYTFVIIAKHSRRFTMLISTQIIHVICLILLLAYTSIADTSLQLLRYLKFTDVNGDVNEVYTYVSPDYEYLTGRHIIYFIIAVLLELIIVCGLPVLLLVEPFVNRWVDFTRVKPLLDQFQSCYKKEYRWFAGIYLLFRQLMIFILVIDFSDQYIKLYLLIVVCLIVLLMHHMAQPYENDALNKYDAIVLHILVLVVTLQMVAFSNGFTADALVGTAYGLFLIPVVAYIVLVVFLTLFRRCTYIDDDQREEIVPLQQH